MSLKLHNLFLILNEGLWLKWIWNCFKILATRSDTFFNTIFQFWSTMLLLSLPVLLNIFLLTLLMNFSSYLFCSNTSWICENSSILYSTSQMVLALCNKVLTTLSLWLFGFVCPCVCVYDECWILNVQYAV